MKRSFYDILGVPHDADQAAIDAAFAVAQERVATEVRRGAEGASMEAQLIRDGYQMLSDPAKRTRYDAKLEASEKGVELMFFPDDRSAQKKLGIQSVVFALLATTFVGVLYWQMNRKLSEVRADYDTVVARKAAAAVTPKVLEAPPAAAATDMAAKSDADKPKVSDGVKGETLIKVIEPSKDVARGASEAQVKR